MRYLRCRTCGRYIDTASAVRRVYCSESCAVSFARCTNCGRFFPTGEGYDEEVCSELCSIRYRIHRFYGALAGGAEGEEAT